MSSTLYRKYRPKNFSEVTGQKHIVQTLSNAIKNQRIGHAYLFTGPRGTGKTSVARIFAKTINCENLRNSETCEKCLSCQTISEGKSLDIIEIDAASNTGVDNIRELRETVNLPPTSLKYKVYIIDEVHMLSTGAFNALLKTLEEPPAHVIFILATTEIHKVPETIISRCQRFDFSRLPLQNIIEKLSLIAKSEKIKIDKESLEMIAISAEGGMRDAESLLAQVMALEDKNITLKEVENILGTTDRKLAYEISEMLIENEAAGAIQKINKILEDGYDLQVFNKSLINYLRQLMLLKINPALKSSFAYEITEEQIEKMTEQSKKIDLEKILSSINLFLEAQNKISSFILPQLPMEIAVIKATHTFPARNNIKHEVEGLPADRRGIKQHISKEPVSTPIRITEKEIEKPEEIIENNIANQESDVYLDKAQANWNRLLEEIKPFNHSLKALLCSCQVAGVNGSEITIATSYDFYKERLNNPANRLTVEQVFGKILGSKISIKTVTNQEAGIIEAPKNKNPEKKPGIQDGLLNSALEIIGGKVVKE